MAGKTQEDLINELVDLIVESKRIVVFTGAGISTESGIPDFRGPDGLWTKYDPEDFTYQKFVSDKEARKRLWGLQKVMNFGLGDVEPNMAHKAVAELERIEKLDCIITQNVDGLHQKAGNSDNKVLQLHGNMQWVKCLSCGVKHSLDEVKGWIDKGVEDPACPECGGILKPDAVFFGEMMPVWETSEAQRRSSECDLCIVIGSTLMVYPAGLMPRYALQGGAKLAIINDGETELDRVAHIRITGKAGDIMAKTIEKVKKRLGGKK